MTGVYFLLHKGKIVYIGATECWPVRIGAHKRIKFDSAKLFECQASRILEYEKRLITIFNPKYNFMHTPKSKGYKMNSDWVKDNLHLIAPLMDGCDSVSKIKEAKIKALPLLEQMKKELNYSPRTNAGDLFFSLKGRYEKISKEFV